MLRAGGVAVVRLGGGTARMSAYYRYTGSDGRTWVERVPVPRSMPRGSRLLWLGCWFRERTAGGCRDFRLLGVREGREVLKRAG